ncbi:MAG: radical SAM protein [Chloroflexota bacterium]
MKETVLLINANVLQPPVSPVGLEYVGEALAASGIAVEVLDLAFIPDWKAALAHKLRTKEFRAIGLTVRNTDDCSFATRKSFLPWVSEVVSEVRRLTHTFVILGGVGFSIMPEAVLRLTHADAGVAGDGEETATALIRCLQKKEDFSHLPNLVYWHKKNVVSNARAYVDLNRWPLPRRRFFDNKKYEELGAMVGIETKRGCARRCIFCADPVAKGRTVRLRPPRIVVEEFQDLLDQGVNWFHLDDSEFNQPMSHARAVCQAIIDSGMGGKMRWYTYCSPAPFDRELARLMKQAGCAGINFGVDSLCDEQLSRLGRRYTVSDIRQLVRWLNKTGINYIFDLLIGGPGETEETIKQTIGQVKQLDVPLVGIATGVRVYSGTPLSQAITDGTFSGNLYPDERSAFNEPVFYLSPHLDNNVNALISRLVGDDLRFLFLTSPAGRSSYNYAGDDALSRMIKAGARGAYWDILSHHRTQ